MTTKSKPVKTYKRELAALLLVFWGYCVVTLDFNTVGAITPWVFLYVLGAFGIDAYSKQVRVSSQGVEIDETGSNSGGY